MIIAESMMREYGLGGACNHLDSFHPHIKEIWICTAGL